MHHHVQAGRLDRRGSFQRSFPAEFPRTSGSTLAPPFGDRATPSTPCGDRARGSEHFTRLLERQQRTFDGQGGAFVADALPSSRPGPRDRVWRHQGES